MIQSKPLVDPRCNDQYVKRRKPTPPIQSLDRGPAILEIVGTARRPVSLAELTPALGIDRSSVFRLANTLKRRAFLAQSPGSKDYVLGSSPPLESPPPWPGFPRPAVRRSVGK
jgi:hypothetical protein